MGLRAKFLVSFVAVTAALSVTSLLLVRERVGRHVREELVQALQNSAVTFDESQRAREAEAQRTVELIADEPLLKAIMSTRDPATIQDASAEIWKMAGADLLAITGASGRLMAVHTSSGEVPRPFAEAHMARATGPSHAHDWWFVGGRLYEVFFADVYVGERAEQNAVGTLAIGFAVNGEFAQKASRIAAGPVAFRYEDRIVASTLPDSAQRELRRLTSADDAGGARELVLGGETFVSTTVQLAAGETPVQLVMLTSYDRATKFLKSLNELILLVAIAAVLLGGACVFVISHTFTRPLAELVTSVRSLAKGDFSYPLTVRGDDEIAELTSAFDRMRRSVQETQARMVNAARLEAIGQLAGGVAHDFNNLVTIIKGYTDLLMCQLKEGDPLTGYAEQIKKAGDRAASVTRQLLAFSRKQVVQRQVLDVNQVALNMSKMLRVLIGEHIEVKITSEAALRKVFLDPSQIEQVLLNLAVNARDAMPNGGLLTIETTNAELVEPAPENPEALPGHYVCLAVSDTGCGMSAETVANIFQPFFTTKEPGKGTGLGLAIVYNVVKQYMGFVRVTSEVGRGSTFRIFLPESKAAADAAAASTVPGRIERQATGTVLVVEDEDALRSLARESLRLGGYDVLEAKDGEDALALCERHNGNISMVITDLVMPRMGGLDLARRLRDTRPRLRVLLMSGYTDRAREVETSGLPLLQKPFTPGQLLQAVSAAAGQ